MVDFRSTFSFMWIHTNWLRKPYVRKFPVTCGRTMVLLSLELFWGLPPTIKLEKSLMCWNDIIPIQFISYNSKIFMEHLLVLSKIQKMQNIEVYSTIKITEIIFLWKRHWWSKNKYTNLLLVALVKDFFTVSLIW